MSTTAPPTPIRDLIAELADTEDLLRECRAGDPTARHRAARRRQGQIVRELRRRPVGVLERPAPAGSVVESNGGGTPTAREPDTG